MKSPILLSLFVALAIAAPAMAQDKLPPVRDQSRIIDYVQGDEALRATLNRVANTRPAKNIILFIGDGMGINSVTAGRILAGQKRGLDGASYRLSFETFPYGGFSKTYSIDNLVTDSANGISAIMTGVKTRNAAIGVDATITGGRCRGSLPARLQTLAEAAKLSGRSAGIVTTAGITDATPVGAYGHTPARNWRSDVDLTAEAIENGCTDLARQLVEAPAAIRMDVALGGDREKFLPDIGSAAKGERADGRDLTREWTSQTPNAFYADGLFALQSAKAKASDHLLGLFSEGDLPSPVDPEHNNVPDLDQMTASAIDVLSRNPNGFFLMVESASIDKWHHVNNAYRALTDVDELSKAVQVALDKTDPKDTLIIVTADHSHGLVLSGYASRGAPVLGLAQIDGKPVLDDNGQPYTLLSYATGPGAKDTDKAPLTEDQVEAPDYHQRALVYANSAKHAGEDVPVYATGPQAQLLSGTMESSYIYQVMAYAFGLKAEKPVVR
jgi:alkaline phosphatase